MRAGGRKSPPPQSFPLGRRLRRKHVHGMDEAASRLRMTAENPRVTRTQELILKILLITKKNPYGTSPFGGAESSTRLLAEKMAARGHKAIYLTMGAGLHDKALAREAGVELFAFPRPPGRRLPIFKALNRMLIQRTIRTLAMRYKVDLIYCFYELEVLEPALRVREQLGWPKVVMRMAGISWFDQVTRQLSLAPRYQGAFRSVDSINFISEGLMAMTDNKLSDLDMQMQFRDNFVQDIGSSAQPGREPEYADLPAAPFRIIMATRFSEQQKRQDLLIRAAALLPRDLQVEIVLSGDGKNLPKMKALATELGVTDQITFLPFLDQSALWCRLQQTHLMCHATDYEGLGKVIVEAMAKGLPVLASDVAPLNGYIREGENGFLVGNTPEAWAARIAELYARREDLARVSEAAMVFAAEHWDPDRSIEVYEDYFFTLVGGIHRQIHQR